MILCILKGVASNSREVIRSSLLSPGEIHMGAASRSGLPCIRQTDILEQVQKRIMKMDQMSMNHLSYGERMRARTVQPDKRRLRGQLLNKYKYLIGGKGERQ